jgi:serine protease
MYAYNFTGIPVLAERLTGIEGSGASQEMQMRRLLPLLAAVIALAALVGVAPAHAQIGVAQSRGFVPHQVIYKLAGQRLGRVLSLPAGTGVARTVATLRSNPRVLYAEPNYIARASAARAEQPLALPDDPGSLGGAAEAASEAVGWAAKQWNFLPWEGAGTPELPVSPGGIDAVGAWQNLARLGKPGAAGVTVAVLDTGIAYRNLFDLFARSPDFFPAQFVRGYDFVNLDLVPLDANGHGTHVAGTIAEHTNNGIGLTGLAYEAELMPVRVLDAQGRGNAVQIAAGIRYAVDHGAEVINMSFNFACGKAVPIVDEALRHAYKAGVVTVASAGNIGSEGCVSEPATGPRVIAVGGTTEGGCLADYSLAGSIDVLAPGGGEPVVGCPSVLSRSIFQVTLQPGSRTEFAIPGDYFGTSMAAAHVSGVAAMALSIGYHRRGAGRLPATRIVNSVTGRLRKTARDLGLPRTQQGAGLIDAGRATDRKLFLG